MKHIGVREYLKFLKSVSSYLDQSLVSKAKHIEHGQWELSFEAVLLGLMETAVEDIELDYELVYALAQEANIIDEGVLDLDTWERFQLWLSENSSDNLSA